MYLVTEVVHRADRQSRLRLPRSIGLYMDANRHFLPKTQRQLNKTPVQCYLRLYRIAFRTIGFRDILKGRTTLSQTVF